MKLFERTFAQVMAEGRGHTNGFDYLRIGLSIGVVIVHCVAIASFTGQKLLWSSPIGPAFTCILPAFFALSGFLVSGSLFRNTIPQFISLRVLRIIPALAVEVVLCALVLGPIFTKLSLFEYLSNPQFASYFLNIVGDIHYVLPGVFDGRMLNAQLWTIPSELECYIFLVIIALVGLTNRRGAFLVLTIFGVVAITFVSLHHSPIKLGQNLPGRVLVFSFLFGVIAYLFRDRIPHSAPLGVLCLVLSYVLFRIPSLSYFATAPIAYVTIYVGLLRLRRIPFGDLSYGVYLFHFPVARTIAQLSGNRLNWIILFLATLVITALFAELSWRFVEEPILKRKRSILAFIDKNSARAIRLLPALRPIEAIKT